MASAERPDFGSLARSPDVPTASVGWRSWEIRGARGDASVLLHSPVGRMAWPESQELTATCRRKPHPAPDESCTCGIYAAREPTGVFGGGHVVGCVALWGKVVEGERGYRAAHGYPLLLLCGPRVSADAVTRLADGYQVPAYRLPVSFKRLAKDHRVGELATRMREQAAVGGRGDQFAELVEELLSEADRVTQGRSGRPGRFRRVFWPALLALVAFGLAQLHPLVFPAATQRSIYNIRVADNPPVGTCVGTGKQWRESAVPDGDTCATPHMGELLGYPRLGAAPSRYPGDAEVNQLAEFGCGRLLAERGLDPDVYGTTMNLPDRGSWNDGTREGYRFENYATCLLLRNDGKKLPPGRVLDPGGPGWAGRPTSMDLFAGDVNQNAPPGRCVQTRKGFQDDVHAVPIVDCAQRHWAEILGYPTLYPPDGRHPGDDEVYLAAEAACKRLRALPAGFELEIVWPAEDWWRNRERPIYTSCLAHRSDNAAFTGSAR